MSSRYTELILRAPISPPLYCHKWEKHTSYLNILFDQKILLDIDIIFNIFLKMFT